jgi:NDP-sugar pyrophosphorylase family protein
MANKGYPSLVTEHSLGYYIHDSLWQDMGTPESLAAADKLLLSERKDLPEKVRQALGTVK